MSNPKVSEPQSPSPSPSPKAKSKTLPPPRDLPQALQWTLQSVDGVERSLVNADNRTITNWCIPALQSFGLIQPVKTIGDLDSFCGRVRRALLTDGNTKLRIPVRTLLSYLCLHGPFALDTNLLTQASIRLAVSEALTGIAEAATNQMAEQEGIAS